MTLAEVVLSTEVFMVLGAGVTAAVMGVFGWALLLLLRLSDLVGRLSEQVEDIEEHAQASEARAQVTEARVRVLELRNIS